MSAATDSIVHNEATTRLQGRARHLRRQAGAVHPLLAEAFHRRAAELDVQAWLEAVWNPPMDVPELADPFAA